MASSGDSLAALEHDLTVVVGVVAGAEGRSRALVGAPMNPIGAPNTRGRTPPPPLLTQGGLLALRARRSLKTRPVPLLP
jgi:hypothetical protein